MGTLIIRKVKVGNVNFEFAATVTLNIRDVNDNTPILNVNKKYSVIEQASSGSVVGVITAIDDDVSDIITYYIE